MSALPVPQIELTPLHSMPHPSLPGVQHVYRFGNGRGASVVQTQGGHFGSSYGGDAGLWELAPIERFTGEGPRDWVRDIDLGVEWGWGDEVIGYLDDAALASLLVRIAAVPE